MICQKCQELHGVTCQLEDVKCRFCERVIENSNNPCYQMDIKDECVCDECMNQLYGIFELYMGMIKLIHQTKSLEGKDIL